MKTQAFRTLRTLIHQLAIESAVQKQQYYNEKPTSKQRQKLITPTVARLHKEHQINQYNQAVSKISKQETP
jgi:hypothetical protein